MQGKEIVLDGKKFFYREEGQGPVVVLIHGFAEEGSIWKQQFGKIPGCRLLVPDLPGSGGSEETEDMSMEGLAESIHDFLDRLTVKKIINTLCQSLHAHVLRFFRSPASGQIRNQ